MTKPKQVCDFTRGYACACAVLAKDDGFTGSGIELLSSGGFSIKELEAAGVDPADIQALQEDSHE